MPPQVGSQVEVCEQCGVVSWHWQPIAKPDLIIFIKMYYVAVEGVCTSCKGVLKRQNVTMSTFVDKSRHIFLIQENPQNRHWQPIAKAGKPTRVVESKSLKVGKSLKIGKNRIKSEKSEFIFY